MSSPDHFSQRTSKSILSNTPAVGIDGTFFSLSEDKRIDLEDREENSEIKESIVDEPRKASRHSRQISGCSIEPQNELDNASVDIFDFPKVWLGHLSPTHRNCDDGTAKSLETNTPTSCASRNTLTLAQLYQSSRRSRRIPQSESNNSIIIPSNILSPPSLIPSISLDTHNIFRDVNTNTHQKELTQSSGVATSPGESCSLDSFGSFKELTTHEAVTANELFGEECPSKRRKITPDQ